MRREVVLVFLSLSAGLVAGDWNLLSYITSRGEEESYNHRNGNLGFGLPDYCEAWRMNVELNNIRGFEVVPGECTGHVGRYMTSTQYDVDLHLAADVVSLFLADEFALAGDGKDAWIFDVDDVLLSTVPYYKSHQFGYVSVQFRFDQKFKN